MIEMVLKYVVLLIVLCERNLCVKLNGTCPVVDNTDAFICTEYFQDAEVLFPMAHLQSENNSLNLFYNPFNYIECIQFTIRCQLDNMKKSTFQIELACTAEDEDAIEFCATSIIDLQNNTGMAAINYNYFLDDEESCFRISNNLSVVKAVSKKFIVFYGCQDLNGTHVEAAWIFGYKANQLESLKYLDEAFQSLRNLTAQRDNFTVFNLTASKNMSGMQCGCNFNQEDPCEYYTRCKLAEYDYYYYYYDD